MPSQEPKTCSFCGQTSHVMIASSNGVSICENCIKQMYKVTARNNVERITEREEKTKGQKLLRPSQIKTFLDEYVVGQDEAKLSLSVAVYNHYKRINEPEDDVEIQKSNVLMIGPTGSGKTYLVQTLAKIIGVPFATADATSMTETGYVGGDVEDILSRLLANANGDIDMAEKGIVYIDEIDKLSKDPSASARQKDVSGGGVQQALLKLLEGSVVEVPVRSEKPSFMPGFAAMAQIDTSNILFICGGAFEGLMDSIQKPESRPIGFGKKEEVRSSSQIETSDLVKYGLMPEFIGRLPVVTVLNPLDKKAMINILTKPKNAIIKQYQKLLFMDGIYLDFDQKALEHIAEKALKKGSGARGLRSIMESCMTRIMFEAPDMKNVDRIQIMESTVETGVPIVMQKKRKSSAK